MFANDDRPGVMLAGAAATYIERYGVAPGRRAVDLHRTTTRRRPCASTLAAAGIEVVETVDARRGPSSSTPARTSTARLAAVRIAPPAPSGDGGPSTVRPSRRTCSLVSGGWNPNVALWTPCPRHAPVRRAHRGVRPGCAGSGRPIEASARPPATSRASARSRRSGSCRRSTRRAERRLGAATTSISGRDATVASLQRALGAGLESIEHVEALHDDRHGCRPGQDLGRRRERDRRRRSSARTSARSACPTYRPPTSARSASPSSPAATAAPSPTRSGTTSIQPWHVAQRRGLRGCRPVETAAVLPASTASRWTTPSCASAARRGPGSRSWTRRRSARSTSRARTPGVFLDRVYTNTFSTLKVGSCRYGLMCTADGMVFDDGVTARLADDRFLMHTTTGNAAAVLDHLEEWLQTEWPDLRVRAHERHRAVGDGRRRRAARRARSSRALCPGPRPRAPRPSRS